MFTAEERRKYIGGSDIASVMMMSRWKTPLTLWLEKTGEIEPDDLSDNEAVQLGVELEDFVACHYCHFVVAGSNRSIAGKDAEKITSAYGS